MSGERYQNGKPERLMVAPKSQPAVLSINYL